MIKKSLSMAFNFLSEKNIKITSSFLSAKTIKGIIKFLTSHDFFFLVPFTLARDIKFFLLFLNNNYASFSFQNLSCRNKTMPCGFLTDKDLSCLYLLLCEKNKEVKYKLLSAEFNKVSYFLYPFISIKGSLVFSYSLGEPEFLIRKINFE